ncbi:MAG: hypothetical protein PHH77_10325 [Victivallaceae bacterium]|nr:hypothetical protein [Victivallaceae bacterium]
MIRIIELNIDEILIAEQACSDLIAQACLRTPAKPYRVAGLAANREKVFVILEPDSSGTPLPEYRFAFLSSLDGKAVSAEISARYYAGFTTVGSFPVDDKLWALLAKLK